MSYVLPEAAANPTTYYWKRAGEADAPQVLALNGNVLSISEGNAVNVSAATSVALSTNKTTAQSYASETNTTTFSGPIAAPTVTAENLLIDTGALPFVNVGGALATLSDAVGALEVKTTGISYAAGTTAVTGTLSVSAIPPAPSAFPAVLGYDTTTGAIKYQNAGSSAGIAAVVAGTNIAVDTTIASAPKVSLDPSGGIDLSNNPLTGAQYINSNGDIQIYKSTPPTIRQVHTGTGDGFEIVTNVETAMGSSGPLIMKGNNSRLYEARLTLASETATLSSPNVPKISALKNSTGATASLAINESNNTIISSSGSLALEPAGATASIKTPNAIFVAGDLTGAHNSYKLEVNDALASASLGKSTGNQLTINDSYVALKGANPSARIGIGDVDGLVNGCKVEVDLATNSTTISAGGAPRLTASTAGVTVSRLIETSLEPYPTTYYVSKSGNDTTGSGSQSNPFLTIQKAITIAEAAGSSATIFINTGSYNEDLIITKNISLIGIDLNIAFKDSVSSPTVNTVEIIGGISNNPVIAGAFTAQYITFTVPTGKQIAYNSASPIGQMNFQYCTITGTTAVNDGISLILTNRHTHWFSNCRISKISATIGVPTIDGGTSSQASLFIISECRIQTRSSTDGIRAGAVQIYDSIVTAASGGTIIRLSGSSTTNSIISATQLQMNTVAGTFITNEKTVALTIQMYNSQFLSFTALTGGLHYLVNNTSASSVALWFSNNKFFQSVGTPLNSTQMYNGLITFVDGVDIRPINMVNGNILEVTNIANASTPLSVSSGADVSIQAASALRLITLGSETVTAKNTLANSVLRVEAAGGKGGEITADEGAGNFVFEGKNGLGTAIQGATYVGISTTDTASGIGMVTGSGETACDFIANGDGTGKIELKAETAVNPLRICLDGAKNNLVLDGNLTSSGNTHFVTFQAQSSGLEVTNWLKILHNGNYIWIPYLTSDPSV